MNDFLSDGRSYAEVAVHQHLPRTTRTSPGVGGGNVFPSPSLVVEPSTGASSKDKQVNKRPQTSKMAISKRKKSSESNDNEVIVNTEESDKEGWTIVDRKKKNQRKRSTGNFGIKGSKKGDSCSLKAAVRRADVYVGRVDRDVTDDDIKNFIQQSFEIEVFSVSKLDIFSDVYNAFKVCVKANVRDKLFDSDKWPEDIVVNKFYNKQSKNVAKDNASSK